MFMAKAIKASIIMVLRKQQVDFLTSLRNVVASSSSSLSQTRFLGTAKTTECATRTMKNQNLCSPSINNVIGRYTRFQRQHATLLPNVWQQYSTSQRTTTILREYHATTRSEIVPLIVAAVLMGGGYYSYRAVQRMNHEWEDYQWALQRYETDQLRNENTKTSMPTIAIDLGTSFGKVAVTTSTVEVVISREGDRNFFNGVVYDKQQRHTNDNTTVCSLGRAAMDRFYFQAFDREVDVLLPFTVLALSAVSPQHKDKARQVVTDVLQPALQEAMQRLDIEKDTTKIRKVVTIPCTFLHNMATYESAFSSLVCSEDGTTLSFVPEPVAACWGAQFNNIFPVEQVKDTSNLVIDVGGWTTQIAVVRNDKVVHAATIPWGGENMVEELVNILKASTSNDKEPLQDARSLALLQVQARNALVELSTKTRVSVYVPYLFADPSNHHLNTSVARTVLEQALQENVRNSLLKYVPSDDLSPHLPTPTDLESLWMSVFTQALEKSSTLPYSIENILLVGGGAKSPLVQRTVGTALQSLMGGDATTKLKRPDLSVLSELTVLGAATLLPSFDYSVENGLVRRFGT